MMMKIKLSCAVAALGILSPASFTHAQHNHIQSSVSGQYDRRIHDGDQSAGATTQAAAKRKKSSLSDMQTKRLENSADKDKDFAGRSKSGLGGSRRDGAGQSTK